MAEPPTAGDAPFDLEKLQQLVEMMEKHGLSEVHLRRGAAASVLRAGTRCGRTADRRTRTRRSSR